MCHCSRYTNDVKEVINEVFNYAKPNTTIIDMTTSDPNLAVKLYEKGKALGFNLIDAPVTGSDVFAKSGTLSIMVGGDKDIYEQILPLLKTFGKIITYVGKSGNGQLAKLANQTAIAGVIAGVVESIYFATINNLDLNLVHQILMGGSASSNQLGNNGLKIINKDLNPGFYIKHFLKDLKLVKQSTKKELLVVNQVVYMLEKLIEKGYENLGTQALILYYLDELVKTA